MPEKMDTVSNNNPPPHGVDINDRINKEKLAEKILALLLREIEIESERVGKTFKSR